MNISIEDCIKKELFGSFEKGKLPNNLTDYYCELCIEEYAQGPVSEEVSYFRFTPRGGVKGEPFNIMIDNIAKPKNLIYEYKIVVGDQERGIDPKIIIGERAQLKLQTTVVEPQKKEPMIQYLPQPDSEGEIVFRDIDQSRLNSNYMRLLESGEEDNGSNQSKCVEPSDGDKGNIKTQLTYYLHVQENRFSKLKDIKSHLQGKGYKISENGLKGLLGEICKSNPSERKTGYALKDVFFNKEEYDRRNPRKKVKQQ